LEKSFGEFSYSELEDVFTAYILVYDRVYPIDEWESYRCINLFLSVIIFFDIPFNLRKKEEKYASTRKEQLNKLEKERQAQEEEEEEKRKANLDEYERSLVLYLIKHFFEYLYVFHHHFFHLLVFLKMRLCKYY
jgi:hypothetical protein